MTRLWRSHSVRRRLTLWYLAAMLVVLGVYIAVIHAFVQRSATESLDQQIRRDFQWTAASIYQLPNGMFTWSQPDELVAEEGLPWVQVWSADGSTLLFRNAEAVAMPVPQSQALARRADNLIVSLPTGTVPLRVLTRRGRIGATMLVIQVARSEVGIRNETSGLTFILLLSLPLAVTVAGLGGYALARRALAPIERMTERARLISAEHLNQRLPVHNPDDEMGRLAGVFNETLGRLEASFGQMRRFTADVSHELRTPLTAIRSVGEVGLRGQRDEHAYRAIIGSMLEEADRLATLVDRLLTLSRAGTQPLTTPSEPIALRGLAEEVVSHLGVLAEERQQSLTVDATGSAVALSDRVVLRQALINLVDNAIKFTPERGSIRVLLSEAGKDARVDVVDSGPGVPADERTRIFDRFYRADDVAARGGSGLGLSIAKSAVESVGGHLTLESSSPAGSTFRITVPRSP